MRGYGAIPDRLDVLDREGRTNAVSGLVGSVPIYATSRDWTPLIDEVKDQRSTNSCVGWAFASAIYLAGQASGAHVERPSATWCYDVARYVATPGVLVDAGCRPRDMIEGLSSHGIVVDSRLPFDARRIDDAPPFDCDIASADALLTGHYRVDEDVPTMFRMALDRGHFPCFALVVSQAFEDLGSTVYDEPNGAELGRHMVALVGYRPGAFRVLNSWGSTWANEGLCWISDRFVASHYVSDRYVITAAPKGIR
jgi:C1A family cysteine protease